MAVLPRRPSFHTSTGSPSSNLRRLISCLGRASLARATRDLESISIRAFRAAVRSSCARLQAASAVGIGRRAQMELTSISKGIQSHLRLPSENSLGRTVARAIGQGLSRPAHLVDEYLNLSKIHRLPKRIPCCSSPSWKALPTNSFPSSYRIHEGAPNTRSHNVTNAFQVSSAERQR